MIALRPYQVAAEKAVIDYWQSGGGNPLVEMATGTGKSMVIANLTR
ncbi:MAG: DEAD/DEAH box helicase family protein, partial [Notoacmeibacter sp.]|nr:DEAD/DEAH box helicase family protein [Notoacmeibacter sp.]